MWWIQFLNTVSWKQKKPATLFDSVCDRISKALQIYYRDTIYLFNLQIN